LLAAAATIVKFELAAGVVSDDVLTLMEYGPAAVGLVAVAPTPSVTLTGVGVDADAPRGVVITTLPGAVVRETAVAGSVTPPIVTL
jgi:hypothetical protein